MRPDRVIVVGVESDRARAVIADVYRPLFLRETPMIQTGLESAEMIKYAANAFLATKITFINEIADLCEKVGADVQKSPRGSGSTGGSGRNSCIRALAMAGRAFPRTRWRWCSTARDHDSPVRIVSTVVEANEARKQAMAGKIIAAGGSRSRASGSRFWASPSSRTPTTCATRPAW